MIAWTSATASTVTESRPGHNRSHVHVQPVPSNLRIKTYTAFTEHGSRRSPWFLW